MSTIMLYTGSVVIFAWGIGHLIPTLSIVRGFGPLSEDNRHIITMEWIAEGVTLCFIGVLVFASAMISGTTSQTTIFIGRSCAGMLLVLAVLSTLTGARTSILPMRICPLIKTLVAISFFMATF
jgi:predicted RND superfamily exporter protein